MKNSTQNEPTAVIAPQQKTKVDHYQSNTASLKERGFKVSFFYSMTRVKVAQDRFVDKPTTTCVISLNDSIISEESVRLNHKDINNKKKARKQAFLKSTSKLSQEDRQFLRTHSPINLHV